MEKVIIKIHTIEVPAGNYIINGKADVLCHTVLIQPHAPQWQDISTAPRDGTEIDLWKPVHGRYTGMHWCNRGWEDINSGRDYSGFTHWMALPTCPKVG